MALPDYNFYVHDYHLGSLDILPLSFLFDQKICRLVHLFGGHIEEEER